MRSRIRSPLRDQGGISAAQTHSGRGFLALMRVLNCCAAVIQPMVRAICALSLIRDSDNEHMPPRWGLEEGLYRPAIDMSPLWG